MPTTRHPDQRIRGGRGEREIDHWRTCMTCICLPSVVCTTCKDLQYTLQTPLIWIQQMIQTQPRKNVNVDQDSLGVVDRPEQREDRDVGRGDFHGDQVGHVVFEGPPRLRTKETEQEEENKMEKKSKTKCAVD